MNLRSFLAQSPELTDGTWVDEFASHWTQKRLSKGGRLTEQEGVEDGEFILLEGCLASTICDADGKEVCVGLYVAPSVVTPNIARTRAGESLVSITAMSDVAVARIDSNRLTELMISSEPIRAWGNTPVTMSRLRAGDRGA